MFNHPFVYTHVRATERTFSFKRVADGWTLNGLLLVHGPACLGTRTRCYRRLARKEPPALMGKPVFEEEPAVSWLEHCSPCAQVSATYLIWLRNLAISVSLSPGDGEGCQEIWRALAIR